jgi:3'-phosphoadenosine 5'-phosphosulfate sulfotransferase (PAPS reductase)/FAD synthetase
MKYIVSISGGKDSTACLLYMLERAKKEDVIPVFCDTKWEADETYEYLFYLEKALDIEIVRIESEGMWALCERKKFVINRHMRSCTMELKIKPFQKWLKENFVGSEEFIVVQGLRREESKARENTEVFELIKSIIAGKKFYIPTLYPIAYWSEDRVFEYIESKSIKVNPLYKKGFKRVGCMPCVNASKYEILYMPKKYRNRLEALEKAIGEQIGKDAFMFNPKGNGKFLKEQLLFDVEELFEKAE